MCFKRTVLYTDCSHTQTLGWKDCATLKKQLKQLLAQHQERQQRQEAAAAAHHHAHLTTDASRGNTRRGGKQQRYNAGGKVKNISLSSSCDSSLGGDDGGVPSLTDTASTVGSENTERPAVPVAVFEIGGGGSSSGGSRVAMPKEEGLEVGVEEGAKLREGCPRLQVVDTGSYPFRCPQCTEAVFEIKAKECAAAIRREAEVRRAREEMGVGRGMKRWVDGLEAVVEGSDVWVCALDSEGGLWRVAWAGSELAWRYGIEMQESVRVAAERERAPDGGE